MKTAMQELIERIEKLSVVDDIINPIGVFKSMAEQLLEAEKKQIVNAHISGQKFAFDNHLPDSEEYYNETFNK